MKECFTFLCLLLLTGLTTQLQAQSGTMSGKIEDPSGSPVPEAQVTVINQGTNAEMNLRTQRDGSFVAPFLPPGVYRIVVDKSGFKQLTFADIKLDVQQSVSLNLALQLGTVSEGIEVTAQS